MSKIKVGSKVRASTLRGKDVHNGKVVGIDTSGKTGAWYEIKTESGETFKTRASKITAR